MSKEIKIGENLLGRIISVCECAEADLKSLIPFSFNDSKHPKQTVKDINSLLEVLNVLKDLENKDGEWTCPDCGSTWINSCPGCDGEAW